MIFSPLYLDGTDTSKNPRPSQTMDTPILVSTNTVSFIFDMVSSLLLLYGTDTLCPFILIRFLSPKFTFKLPIYELKKKYTYNIYTTVIVFYVFFHNIIKNRFCTYSQGNRFRPSRMFRVPRIVSHPNAKRPTDAICAQKILARSLETKEFPIVRSVMRVTKYSTNTVH